MQRNPDSPARAGPLALANDDAAAAVETAVGLGYRHFDPAENCRNGFDGVRRAWKPILR